MGRVRGAVQPSAIRRVVFDTISPDALLHRAILGRIMGCRKPILDQDEQGVPPFVVRQTPRRVDCVENRENNGGVGRTRTGAHRAAKPALSL